MPWLSRRPSAEEINGIQSELRKLSHALNRPIEWIGFRPGGKSLFGGDGPWRPDRAERIRAAAELLVNYLNLIYRCGPVHAVCKGCGGLMMTAPGKPKRYCMRQCRWRSDDERKKYFREKQRDRRKALKDLQSGAKARKR